MTAAESDWDPTLCSLLDHMAQGRGVGPLPHRRQPAGVPDRRRRLSGEARADAGAGRDDGRVAARSPTQRDEFARTLEMNLALALAHRRRGSAPTCSASAARSGMVIRLVRTHDQDARGARPPADPRRGHAEQARPRARGRRHRQRQVDDARRDDRSPQPGRDRPHHHDRGPDRVHPPAPAAAWSPSARSASTRCRIAMRSRTRCARRPTSS